MSVIVHQCGGNHRTYRTYARCVWPRACWIVGDGPYAVLAHCRVLTVTLHPTAHQAEASKAVIDRTACGGLCHNDHEVVRLERP